MQQRSHPSAPLRSDTAEVLHGWRTALAAARESEESDLYACAVVLVLEVLDHCATLQDLLNAYRSPDAAQKANVFALCGKGEIRLEPWVVMGTACALRCRQLMTAAIA